ncbi:MAG: thiE2, partial [Herbinix sp.]|nr:thiE2 [Herbinix sp.]
MKLKKEDMLLYIVTDRSWLGEGSLADQVEVILKAGATFLQLREKELPFKDFVSEAKQIKNITDQYRIPFVINDNVDVAIAVDADGVHLGQG